MVKSLIQQIILDPGLWVRIVGASSLMRNELLFLDKCFFFFLSLVHLNAYSFKKIYIGSVWKIWKRDDGRRRSKMSQILTLIIPELQFDLLLVLVGVYKCCWLKFQKLQDTLKSSPPENLVMKKATTVAVSITSVFYLLCGVLGYVAFGNNAPGNFLTGFGFYEPYWLIDIANICIVVHIVGAYQVNLKNGLAYKWL